MDALGFIFSDVGRLGELPSRHRMWWVCVRYKESVHACTRVGVCVYMSVLRSGLGLVGHSMAL